MDGDVKLNGGSVKIEGDQLQTNVQELDMHFKNSHFIANNGSLYLKSEAQGSGGGIISIQGDNQLLLSSSNTVNMKGHVNLSGDGLGIFNPNAANSGSHLALSHTEYDTLSLNSNLDYKSGIELRGTVSVSSGDLIIKKEVKMDPHKPVDVGGHKFPRPQFGDDLPGTHPTIFIRNMNVFETISELQDTIAELKKRIETLEAK